MGLGAPLPVGLERELCSRWGRPPGGAAVGAGARVRVERSSVFAARGGHLEVLRWAHEHGCPLSVITCSEAASGGHLRVLQYAREHGCPWDVGAARGTCAFAAIGGYLELLRWAHEHGCRGTHPRVRTQSMAGTWRC